MLILSYCSHLIDWITSHRRHLTQNSCWYKKKLRSFLMIPFSAVSSFTEFHLCHTSIHYSFKTYLCFCFSIIDAINLFNLTCLETFLKYSKIHLWMDSSNWRLPNHKRKHGDSAKCTVHGGMSEQMHLPRVVSFSGVSSWEVHLSMQSGQQTYTSKQIWGGPHPELFRYYM